MAVSLNVKSNIKEFTRGLDRVQKKQVPFATARALTWTAKDCQKGIIKWIQVVFNVTKKWWMPQQPTGIKIKSATKKRLISTVFTRAYFAFIQEVGGTKRPHRSKNLLIPSKKVPKSRRKAGGASTMLKNKNTFSTSRGVFRRKGGKKRKNQKLELLFHKDKTADIQPRFRFKEMARKIALRMFKKNFLRSLAMALKTAR